MLSEGSPGLSIGNGKEAESQGLQGAGNVLRGLENSKQESDGSWAARMMERRGL